MYINIGDGGNREGLNDFLDPQPAWSAVREPSYGHGAPGHESTTFAPQGVRQASVVGFIFLGSSS